MAEYEPLIEKYANTKYLIYSYWIPNGTWGNKNAARAFLQKYWINEDEYQSTWKKKQNKIFINQDQGLKAMVFSNEYRFIAQRTGGLFYKKSFLKLQECVLSMRGKTIVIIENMIDYDPSRPPFRLKFPATITWPELMSGNFISAALFQHAITHYFVFGESAAWGKYTSNDYDLFLNIIGFLPIYASLFKRVFTLNPYDQKTIDSWLPKVYRNRLA